jgi:hypothetical protein
MLEGYNLVYCGPEKWEGLWRNRHQLMSRFARCNKVLYVEPKLYFNQVRRQWGEGTLHWRDFWQDFRRSQVTKAGDNLYIYRSPVGILRIAFPGLCGGGFSRQQCESWALINQLSGFPGRTWSV